MADTPEQALIAKLRSFAEDDVLRMRREVSIRRDQFVDEHDLETWGALMNEAADTIAALLASRPQPEQDNEGHAALRAIVAEMRQKGKASVLNCWADQIELALSTVAASPPQREPSKIVAGLLARWRQEADELEEATGGHWIEPGIVRQCADELEEEFTDPMAGPQREPETHPQFGNGPEQAPSCDEEAAFKAGYHCRWTGRSYTFDPLMSPGDAGGAFEAWARWKDREQL